jgi:hypothetical protein
MIGTILSFHPGFGGLLRGEDGRRYPFEAAAWPGDSPPVPGTKVDFERDGDAARDLLPLPAEAAPAPAGDTAGWIAARPGLPIASLLLAACFLPFLTLGPFSANLFNVVGVASSLGRHAPANLNMEAGLWLFHGLHVVPVAALLLIVLEYYGRAGRWWRIGTGLVGLLAPVAIALGARALFTAAAPQAGLGARLARRARDYFSPDLFVPQIGLGWIAIAALSLGLVLIGIFWSSPRAKRMD